MTNKYSEPPDPFTGHHLERDNECGLKASPLCTGQLKDNTGTYKQQLTKDGKIVSMCNACANFMIEEIARRKAKSESKT